MESSDHARFNIDCKGQPGAPNRLPVLAIHDNYIYQSVVDLDHFHGALRL